MRRMRDVVVFSDSGSAENKRLFGRAGVAGRSGGGRSESDIGSGWDEVLEVARAFRRGCNGTREGAVVIAGYGGDTVES